MLHKTGSWQLGPLQVDSCRVKNLRNPRCKGQHLEEDTGRGGSSAVKLSGTTVGFLSIGTLEMDPEHGGVCE
jgi:hypothetical protein